jgi:hypothetical protein
LSSCPLGSGARRTLPALSPPRQALRLGFPKPANPRVAVVWWERDGQATAKEMDEAIAELIERARASRGCGLCPKCREAARAAGAKATSPEAKMQPRVDKIKALTVEGQAKVKLPPRP